MYDTRVLLKNGSIINHNGLIIKITSVLGKGGNSVAYTAEYEDSVISGGIHKCILKELFPYHPDGAIYRGDDGSLICKDEAKEFFEVHKKSYEYGNRMHLKILAKSPDSIGANFDSFESRGTMYSIIGLNSLSTLRSIKSSLSSFKDVVDIIIKLTKAIEEFHKNEILHLDISPDNVIVSGKDNDCRVLLIDFNSSNIKKDCDEVSLEFSSVNMGYSPPEIKMSRVSEISYSADIFSVCAVFASLLLETDFVYATSNIKSIMSSKLVDDIPHTAKNKLCSILSKGLRANPKIRYQNTSELLEALTELKNRIDNKGLSHSSLWETSRLLATPVSDDYIPNNIKCGDAIQCADTLLSFGNTVICGEGGVGKTTLYKKLHYDSSRSYNPNEPVCFYVPLYRYDGMPDFIKRYILSKVHYSDDMSTLSDAINKLNELMNSDKKFLYLLLDGFNEITIDKNEIIKEITELEAFQGVNITVSERADNLVSGDFLENFTGVSLCSLDPEDIRQYLNKNDLAFPEDEAVIELLRNPLMLTLYTKSENVFKDSPKYRPGSVTKEEIINGYLDSLCQSYKKANPGDQKGLVRLSYIVKYLFPAICHQCEKNASITQDSIKKVCSGDFRVLKSLSFSRFYKEFTGKSKDILDGIANKDEWFDTAVQRILVSETALLAEENGIFRPIHMNLTEVLDSNFRENNKKYVKTRLFSVMPKVFLSIAASLFLLGAIIYFMPAKNAPTNSDNQTENSNQTLVTDNMLIACKDFCAINSAESDVFACLNDTVLTDKERIKKIDDAEAELGKKESYESKIGNELKTLLSSDITDDDIKNLREVFDHPQKSRIIQQELFTNLKIAIENDLLDENAYIELSKLQAEYSKNNSNLFASLCARCAKKLSANSKSSYEKDLKSENPAIYDIYVDCVSMSDKELENYISQCKNEITKNCAEMKDILLISEGYILANTVLYNNYDKICSYWYRYIEENTDVIEAGEAFIANPSKDTAEYMLSKITELPNGGRITEDVPSYISEDGEFVVNKDFSLSQEQYETLERYLNVNISNNYNTGILNTTALISSVVDWDDAKESLKNLIYAETLEECISGVCNHAKNEYNMCNIHVDYAHVYVYIMSNISMDMLAHTAIPVMIMGSVAEIEDEENDRFREMLEDYPAMWADSKRLILGIEEYDKANEEDLKQLYEIYPQIAPSLSFDEREKNKSGWTRDYNSLMELYNLSMKVYNQRTEHLINKGYLDEIKYVEETQKTGEMADHPIDEEDIPGINP
ncbi:MAG: NACHT domain-containing protein [Clostridia bacterium]|nr:NACHT domain-containing protein [Clostridia bacterium]